MAAGMNNITMMSIEMVTLARRLMLQPISSVWISLDPTILLVIVVSRFALFPGEKKVCVCAFYTHPGRDPPVRLGLREKSSSLVSGRVLIPTSLAYRSSLPQLRLTYDSVCGRRCVSSATRTTPSATSRSSWRRRPGPGPRRSASRSGTPSTRTTSPSATTRSTTAWASSSTTTGWYELS